MNFQKEPFLAKYSSGQQMLLLMMLALLCMIVFSAIGVFGAIAFYKVNIFEKFEKTFYLIILYLDVCLL
jgi:hypothetical protein